MRVGAIDLLPPGTWSPASPDADRELAALVRRIGHPLPADLLELHRRCANVSLLRERYRFLTPREICPIGELQAGETSDDSTPRTWLAAVDLWDGNYLGLDLIPNTDGSYNWLDCCHENLGEAAVIATSLEELVRRALSCPDGLYWLEPGFRPYRRLKYENPPSSWRRSHGEWYATLGEERGPERCAADDCGRFRIAHSVMCRKHLYEMVHRRRSPFGDD